MPNRNRLLPRGVVAGRSPLAAHNYSTPNWQPLERAVQQAGLPAETCGEFMWMGEWKPGEHSYKHILTRKYAVLNVNPSPLDDSRVQEARR